MYSPARGTMSKETIASGSLTHAGWEVPLLFLGSTWKEPDLFFLTHLLPGTLPSLYKWDLRAPLGSPHNALNWFLSPALGEQVPSGHSSVIEIDLWFHPAVASSKHPEMPKSRCLRNKSLFFLSHSCPLPNLSFFRLFLTPKLTHSNGWLFRTVELVLLWEGGVRTRILPPKGTRVQGNQRHWWQKQAYCEKDLWPMASLEPKGLSGKDGTWDERIKITKLHWLTGKHTDTT